jgi:hypothetical protein
MIFIAIPFIEQDASPLFTSQDRSPNLTKELFGLQKGFKQFLSLPYTLIDWFI